VLIEIVTNNKLKSEGGTYPRRMSETEIGLPPDVSHLEAALDSTMAGSLPKKGRIACQPGDCPCARPKKS
jgi:hypothetical protein